MIRTPDLITEKLYSIDKMKIRDIPYQNLSKFVRESSRLENPIFIATNTGKTRSLQSFKCRFHNKEPFCSSYINYILRDSKIEKYTDKEEKYMNKIISIESNMLHNHPIEDIDKDDNVRNSVPQNIIDIIVNGTKNNETTAQIRSKHGIFISNTKMFEIRRPILKEKYENEFKKVIQYGETLTGYNQIVVYDDDNNYCGLYYFKKSVMGMKYASDILIIDDTMCTNNFNYPIIVCLTVDYNGVSQVLSFGLIKNKTTDSFRDFFVKLKDQMKKDIKLFVCDRSDAQKNGFTSVYPNAKYIYCSRHIATNLISTFGMNSEIIHKFNQLINGIYSEEAFLMELNQIIEANLNEKTRAIRNLIEDKSHYMPSFIDKYEHFGNTTTNRIEGFFGSLKNYLHHMFDDLEWIVRNIVVLAELAFRRKITKKHVYTDILLSKEDQEIVGYGAIKIINHIYATLYPYQAREFCKCNEPLGLPCGHMIKYRVEKGELPLLKSTDFHVHYMKNVDEDFITPSTSSLEKRSTIATRKKDFNYYMENFSQYFGLSHRKKDIRQLLDNALIQLKKVSETEIDAIHDESTIREPPKPKIAGKKATRPALLVRPKRKNPKSSKTSPHISKKPKTK